MSFNQLDKVVIIEIGKYLTLYNDYISLLLTCKKVAHILISFRADKYPQSCNNLNIHLKYCVWTKHEFTYTNFLHIYRKMIQSSTTESSSAVLYWTGKYSKGWYDRSGTSQRIDITYPVTFLKDNVAGMNEPYIFTSYKLEVEVENLMSRDSLKLTVNNGIVTFPEITSFHNFLNELKIVARHREEITRRWNYNDEKEICFRKL
jgi:hypothetical protein